MDLVSGKIRPDEIGKKSWSRILFASLMTKNLPLTRNGSLVLFQKQKHRPTPENVPTAKTQHILQKTAMVHSRSIQRFTTLGIFSFKASNMLGF